MSATTTPSSEETPLHDAHGKNRWFFGRRYANSFHQRVIEFFGIIGYFVCTGLCAVKMSQVIGGVDPLVAAGVGVATFAFSFLVADFVSGLVHWMGDTFGTEDWAFVGPMFIRPFRIHHVDPKDITLHDFIATNGNASVVLMLFLGPVTFLAPTSWGLASFVILTFSLGMSLGIFFTNQFHKWAHESDPPALARFLQRFHLVLTSPGHDIHHTHPFRESYCITTGWLNPLFDRIQLWRKLEAAVSSVTGNDYSEGGKLKGYD